MFNTALSKTVVLNEELLYCIMEELFFQGKEYVAGRILGRRYFVVQSTYTLECFSKVGVRVQLLL